MTPQASMPDLTALREQGGISLRQIADTTKIGVYYLELIERGQFGKLPGGIYNTSYIRQYARAVGLPEEALIAWYLATTLPGSGSPRLAAAGCGRD
jgi:cytoskeletal protein RodZ